MTTPFMPASALSVSTGLSAGPPKKPSFAKKKKGPNGAHLAQAARLHGAGKHNEAANMALNYVNEAKRYVASAANQPDAEVGETGPDESEAQQSGPGSSAPKFRMAGPPKPTPNVPQTPASIPKSPNVGRYKLATALLKKRGA